MSAQAFGRAEPDRDLQGTGRVGRPRELARPSSSAATQGIAVLTGLQEDFSWRSVAASAVGAAAGAAVAEYTKDALSLLPGAQDGFWKTLTTGTVSGFASGVTMAAMRSGKIDFLRIAADAFGNTLGNSIGEALKPASWSRRR